MPFAARSQELQRLVVILLAVAFALLVTVVVATGFLLQRTRDYQAEVDRIHQVRALSDDILTDAFNAETSERGYLLTGERYFLDGGEQSISRLPSQTRRLRSLVGVEDPAVGRAVEALTAQVDDKAAGMQHIIALMDAGRRDEALEAMRSGRGHALMLQIKELSAEIDRSEAALLDRQSRAASQAGRTTLIVNVLSALLILLVGLATVALVRRYIGQLTASRSELDRVNRGLEQTVAERTEELVKANDEISGSRDRAETLLREVNHRVANSLSIVSSFVQLQSRTLPGGEARSALEESQARIQAVSQIHKRLYTSSDVTSVDLKGYLGALCEELQQSLAAPDRGAIHIRVEADPLRAPTDQAVSLGVVAAELVTNAAKYAYPRSDGGEIRVRLCAEGSDGGALVVEDDGEGMTADEPRGTGLGNRIISSMAQALKGEIEYGPADGRGVRARLTFKL
jgi:two-component sensor histidine kinase